jgi:protein kinase A
MTRENLKGYRFHKVVGQGAFGTVYRATDRDDCLCALKFMRKEQLVRHRQLDHLRDEVQCLTQLLGEPAFVQFQGIYESESFVAIIQELVQGMNLPEVTSQVLLDPQ